MKITRLAIGVVHITLHVINRLHDGGSNTIYSLIWTQYIMFEKKCRLTLQCVYDAVLNVNTTTRLMWQLDNPWTNKKVPTESKPLSQHTGNRTRPAVVISTDVVRVPKHLTSFQGVFRRAPTTYCYLQTAARDLDRYGCRAVRLTAHRNTNRVWWEQNETHALRLGSH